MAAASFLLVLKKLVLTVTARVFVVFGGDEPLEFPTLLFLLTSGSVIFYVAVVLS